MQKRLRISGLRDRLWRGHHFVQVVRGYTGEHNYSNLDGNWENKAVARSGRGQRRTAMDNAVESVC